MLKQSSNQPTKLNPDEILKIDTSLQSGIKARASYNLKNYINPPSYKNKALNFKSNEGRKPVPQGGLFAVPTRHQGKIF